MKNFFGNFTVNQDFRNFKLLAILTLVLLSTFVDSTTPATKNSTTKIPEQLNNATKTSQRVLIQNRLNQVLAKALDGLFPSQLRFLANSLLGKIHSEALFKSVASYVIPTASHNNAISQQCQQDSWLYAESLTNFTDWAVKMFDPTSKVPDGMFSGNYHSMGHFDQCLKLKGPKGDSGSKFTGKYCTVFIRLEPVPAEGRSRKSSTKFSFDGMKALLPVPNIDSETLEKISFSYIISQLPNLALCLPSSCSASDIESGLADIVASIGLPDISGMPIVPFASEDFCTATDKPRNFDLATTIFVVILGIQVMFLVLGTAYDAYLRQKDEESVQGLTKQCHLLLSFSVLTNGSKILDTKSSSEGNLACLHGIRALSCCWVLLGHTFCRGLDSPNANVVQVKEDFARWSFQYITNGTLSVDSFLFLSGLLVAYVTLRELDNRKGKLSVPLMYLNRLLRLTPVYAFLLFFLATLFAHLGSGPYWGQIVLQSESCRNSWWYHLSYISNFFFENLDISTCMGEAWYLAVDLQMFIVSPMFIYALWRTPPLGKALLGVAIVGFTTVTMFIIFFENLPPTFVISVIADLKVLLKFYGDYYQMPWCRIMPYLVGIFMGYVLHSSKNAKRDLKPWIVGTSWSVTTGMALLILFGVYWYEQETGEAVFSVYFSVLYGSLHRTLWAVCLSWLVFACVHGYGGFVNKFLSWSVFIPLSRIAYCTYMVHQHWMAYIIARTRTVRYYTATET